MAREPIRFLLRALGGLALVACGHRDALNPSSHPIDDTAWVSGDDSAGDTAAPNDTGSGSQEGWTLGPELPDCTPEQGRGSRVALSGVVLAPAGAEAGYVVYDQQSGLIECVGPDCDTTDTTVVCTEGVISPGLIDTHNHLQYNVLPPWQHDALYTDRYEWQRDGDYWDYRSSYDDIKNTYPCEIMKWAELRDLVSGATSAVGSTGGSCIAPLVRDLDDDASTHFIEGYSLKYSSSNVSSSISEGDGARYEAGLADGTYDAIANHVAEGINGSVSDEIDHMFDVGMSGPGEVYVHATDATVAQLARMATDGTAIIWSPRSNLDLYGRTTPADVALRIGVPVAIGPDWTWSGSMNPPRELACAHDYLAARSAGISDVTLWEMATDQAARVLGLDGVLGALEPGMQADIAVYDWSEQPYRAVIEAGATDVRLVVIAGQALYGTPDMVATLATHPDWCESVSACGADRTLCVKSASSGDGSQTYADLAATLDAAIASASTPENHPYAHELLGLWLCSETRASCDLSAPSADDTDGDGVADLDDDCPNAWDPDQHNYDGDSTGDACDPCPLAPGITNCTGSTHDIDGDGITTTDDDCPYFYNPDQTDTDGDGMGDACDRCPLVSNPGDSACPVSIEALRDPTDPAHPAQGDEVSVSGVVVTAVRDGVGFYVQDPAASEYAGIFVYDQGDASTVGTTGAVEPGDVVSIDGQYLEYYDLSEVAYATTTVTGTSAVPEPIEVSHPCAIGTGGADAERYESMLVKVGATTVTSSNPDAPDDYGEFEVDGCLRVDDQLYSGLVPQPEVGTTFSSLTGVLSYTYGNNKLEPRNADDISY